MCFSLEVSVGAFLAAVSMHFATIWACVESPNAEAVAWGKFVAVSSVFCFTTFMQLAEALGHMTLDAPYGHSLAGALGYILNMLQPTAAAVGVAYVLGLTGVWAGSSIIALLAGSAVALFSTWLYVFAEDRTVFLFKYRPVRFPLKHQSYSIEYTWFSGGALGTHWSAQWIQVLYFACLAVPCVLLLVFASYSSDSSDSSDAAAFQNFCNEAVFLSFATLLLSLAAAYTRSEEIASGSVWCLAAVPTLFYLDLGIVRHTTSGAYANTLFCVTVVAAAVGVLFGRCVGGTTPHSRQRLPAPQAGKAGKVGTELPMVLLSN